MSDAVMDQANDTRRTALGTLLMEHGYLNQEQLDDALRVAADNGERLGEVIVRRGLISEEELAQVLAEQWQLRYCERSAISFDSKALRRMSREDATRLEALPIQEGNEGIIVAVAEPTEARLLALRALLGDRIDFVVVAKTAIETGLRSELLAKSWTGSDGATQAGQFDTYDEPAYEQEAQTESAAPPAEYDAEAGAQAVDAFEQVARLLRDALAEVEQLRGVVAKAKDAQEHDRRERERLEAEVAQQRDELETRNETIRSMQQTLREFADGLAARAG